MFEGRTVLVVVPARGGSKGLPGKNMRPMNGVPLVGHAAVVIRELPWIDRAVISTDDPAIAAVAVAHGLAAPFLRPGELATDHVGDAPVLAHALREMEERDGREYDLVVMLQPTSPLRRAKHVEATVRAVVGGGWDAVWTVSPSDPKYHPLKQLALDDERLILWDVRGAAITARQQLSPVYHRNGAAYVVTRGCLLEHGTLLGPRTGAVVIDEPMISIDTLHDLERAEAIVRGREAGRSE